MRTRLRPLALVSCALALAACDSPSDPEPMSLVAFNYAGPVAGAYRAEGGLRGGTSALNQTGTLAGREGAAVAMVAVVRRGENRADWLTISLPRLTPGSLPISTGCIPATECAQVAVTFGLTNFQGPVADHTCVLASGTIQLAELADTRARGEFSGSGWCLGPDGARVEGFQITGGVFDVPLD